VGSGGNPLNIIAYTLKNSGKYFFDVCNLFSASVNYDDQQKRVVLAFNDNLKVILGNRDIYIKPLQERGIKVSLSILPNHMGVGLANLPEATIVDFVQQIKDAVDTYGLDGVDFDDEWAEYEKAPLPLPPNAATTRNDYANLIAEVRRVMPDKLITLYYVGATTQIRRNATIGGINIDASTMIDYSYYAQYGGWNIAYTSNLRTLTKLQWGPAPLSFSGSDASTFINASNAPVAYNTTYMNNLVNGGYGVNLMYNLGSLDYTMLLTKVSSILWEQETVLTGKLYDGVGNL
jgi:hypothetical protein